MKVADVARRIGARSPGPETAGTEVTGCSIDSRTARAGDVFFALEGERHDGHEYTADALAKGAVAAVVARTVPGADAARLLVVRDTLGALQGLARDLLGEWSGSVVGVTGSAGKTTTKDLTALVLATAAPTQKSVGNLNNAYGLPKTVLDVAFEGGSLAAYKYLVLEMGMSTPGEIRRLTEIAPPEVGIVTLVAPVHLEFFEDGIEGIAQAKAELVEGVVPGGAAVVNADDERVVRMVDLRADVRPIRYSVEGDGDVTARDLAPAGLGGTRFRLTTPKGKADVHLPLVGRHNVSNALAAAGAGVAFGLEPDAIASALSSAEPVTMRGQVVRLGNGAVVIDDSYNSNPRALDEMVASLCALEGDGRRVVVAGEMLELGPTSTELHWQSGRHAARSGVDELIGVRGDARALVEGAREGGVTRALFVEAPEEAAAALAKTLEAGDVVLVKGSRGVATERVVAELVRLFGARGVG
jgi:UDP-N-acetylmuramoyl-tripeptide--D-alanyl-D-alanine ligase